MIQSLRRWHFQIWIGLLVILPPAILISWLVIPNSIPVKLLQNQEQTVLPNIQAESDHVNYVVRLRCNDSKSQWQLEWRNKSVLIVPSAVIYQIIDSGTHISNQKLIGRIEAKGNYVFPLSDFDEMKSQTFLLYDFIKEQNVAVIQFKISKP